ncbi:MAG: hypothetical protein H7221_01895, partial [Flavobacterium sp.]|nr:hypothetical protein [Flavobacterium sp.]
RILTKDDIFPPEELEYDRIIQAKKKLTNDKSNVPMKIRKETLEYDKPKPTKQKK